MPVSVTYKFTQRLNAPAKTAYRWCTDYQPDDLLLMHEQGHRRIEWITDDTVILREVIRKNGKKIRKVKLVKLDASNLSWYNIQISGPNKHSAFLYRIVPEARNRSRLYFTGLLVVYRRARLTGSKLAKIARNERRYDSNAWKRLAKALHEETNKFKR